MLVQDSIRQRIVNIITRRKSGHLCASLSVVDILLAAFNLWWDPSSKSMPGIDLVLSKGHAAPALYAILEYLGAIEGLEESFRRYGSDFEGHPRAHRLPTSIVSTGSLGLGLAFCVGRAIARSRLSGDSHCLIVSSDGEMQCGVAYEALRLLAVERPVGVRIVVDYNGWQTSGRAPKFGYSELAQALNLGFVEVDGHDLIALEVVFRQEAKVPMIVLAKTTRCKGALGYEDGMEIYGDSLDVAQADRISTGLSNSKGGKAL